MGQNNYQGDLQKPVGSGFSAQSTASDVIRDIDLSGKIAMVTGGSAGIGLETTKILAGAGATVIVVARDMEKAKKNLDGVENVELEPVDFMDPQSIDAFALKFAASGRPLHLLINNAGIQIAALRRDARGNEAHLATNYLGQFHLTARLWPALKRANGARVVNLSSYAHRLASFNFDDPNFTNREFDAIAAYGQSKTATNLFTVELDERGKDFGITAFAVHPGSVYGTEIGREATLELFQQMGFLDATGNMVPAVAAVLKTVPQGAATSVWCATSPRLDSVGGVYCEDGDVALLDDNNTLDSYTTLSKGVKLYSLDKENAKRLWKFGEERTKINF